MSFKNSFLQIFSRYFLVVFCLFFGGGIFVYSAEMTSSSFKVIDSTISNGSFSSSASYQLFSGISQIASGKNVSSSFNNNSGFLYFPALSVPVVSAVAGDGQVSLSWSASTGYLGWTVSGYNLGQSLSHGGPYVYTPLGDVTATTVAGLNNSTTYYFVIVTKDFFGNPVATSTEVAVTPTGTSVVPTGGSGGGGGGGNSFASENSVVFSGRAYPRSTVTLLKDSQIVAKTVSDAGANFQITLSNISSGKYVFTLYSEDDKGIRSESVIYPVSVTSGVTVRIGSIFIAPTIAVDKSEVKQGDNIAIFGQSTPSSEITISVHSQEEFFVKKKTDKSGAYLLNFDTSVLEKGEHNTKSKVTLLEEMSSFSKVVGFTVGNKNVLANIKAIKCPAKADLNNDCKVNLVDFSIVAYWYKRPISSDFREVERNKLNGDGKINLVDLSIMAYYWTG